jgi:hypothetical protein
MPNVPGPGRGGRPADDNGSRRDPNFDRNPNVRRPRPDGDAGFDRNPGIDRARRIRRPVQAPAERFEPTRIPDPDGFPPSEYPPAWGDRGDRAGGEGGRSARDGAAPVEAEPVTGEPWLYPEPPPGAPESSEPVTGAAADDNGTGTGTDDGYGRFIAGTVPTARERTGNNGSELLNLGPPPLRDRTWGKGVIVLGVLALLAAVAAVGNAWLNGGGPAVDNAPLPGNDAPSISLAPASTVPLDPPLGPVTAPAGTKAISSDEVGAGFAYPQNWVALDLTIGQAQPVQDFLKAAGGSVDPTSRLLTAAIQSGGVFLATDPATGDAPGRVAVILSLVAGGPPPAPGAPAAASKAPGALDPPLPDLVSADVKTSLSQGSGITVDRVAPATQVGPYRVIGASGQCPVPVGNANTAVSCSTADFIAGNRHWRLTMVGLATPDQRDPFLNQILTSLVAVPRPN